MIHNTRPAKSLSDRGDRAFPVGAAVVGVGIAGSGRAAAVTALAGHPYPPPYGDAAGKLDSGSSSGAACCCAPVTAEYPAPPGTIPSTGSPSPTPQTAPGSPGTRSHGTPGGSSARIPGNPTPSRRKRGACPAPLLTAAPRLNQTGCATNDTETGPPGNPSAIAAD